MKILVYSDNHWCQYSSILRKRGDKYSVRLENQIKSINWAENLAEKLGCGVVIHCGDFFDKESLNSMELTALNELVFSDMTHFMLIGNHEMGLASLDYSSTHLFGIESNFSIINRPTTLDVDSNTQICFLPYDIKSDGKKIEDVFPKTEKKRIIFSHNDLKGLQLGQYISSHGFELEDIENNCDLFINGHIHNGGRISKVIFNIGNLTGQNFSEDGFKYDHVVFVVDTETLKIEVYDNPYAINFYKVDFTENNSIDYINEVSSKMHNAVVTIKCNEEDADYLQKRFGNIEDRIVPHHSSILESRFIIVSKEVAVDNNEIEDLSVDHISEFKKYILQEFTSSEIVLDELQKIFE